MSARLQERLGTEVSFVTNQKKRVVARVDEMTPKKLIFAMVSSGMELNVSEILLDAVVTVNGRRRYEGRLEIVGLVPLGVTILCEARLMGEWESSMDLEGFAVKAAENLVAHTEGWARLHDIRPQYRAAVADFETYLMGLQSWCHEIELALVKEGKNRAERERAILEAVGPTVCAEVDSHFTDFEVASEEIAPANRASHRLHAMKAVHRFFLQSPFTHRCYTKPLGFAGDYEMVHMMMRDPFQGEGLFAKLLNNAFLRTGPVVAHRNRITYLIKQLKLVAERCQKEGRRARILNLGCGPAQEICDFIEQAPELAALCDLELLDFSEETLSFTSDQLKASVSEAGIGTHYKLIEMSIQSFLKQTTRGEQFEHETYDFVYCAGLFDYLQQKFCLRLVDSLGALIQSDGLVVVTNVAESNSIPYVMEDLLEWRIIHRNKQEMLEFGNSEIYGIFKDLKSDRTSINWFLELRKSPFQDHVRNLLPAVQSQEVGSGVSRSLRARGGRATSPQLPNH